MLDKFRDENNDFHEGKNVENQKRHTPSENSNIPEKSSIDHSRRRKKKKKTFFQMFMSTLWTIMKVVVPTAFLIGVIFIIFIMASADRLDVDDLRLDLTSSICYLDDNGEMHEYEEISTSENRYWVPLNKVPQYMRDAFVSIEDERFYTHSGFDIKRTTKAVFDYIRHGSQAQGGSTITQQLIKNLTENDKRTPVRKIQEIWMAYQLERKLSKDQILEFYVNTIYLAQGVNGVQTAAKLYFDKDVSELTLAQCASIAGITQYPAYYDPFIHPDNNKEKQQIVLKKMLELGRISEDEYNNATNEQLVFVKGNMKTTTTRNQSYFTDQVVQDVISEFMKQKGLSKTLAERKLQSGGYKIIATIDPDIQKSIDNVFNSTANFPSSPVSPAPQGAMVVMDTHTGEVKGMAGGIGKKTGAFSLNRATSTYRQPGSSFKPIAVYAPAIDMGLIRPGDTYVDKKLDIDGWSPENSNKSYRGTVTVRTAVMLSINTVAAQILYKDLHIDNSYNYVKNRFHISSVKESDKAYAALSLGGLTNGASVMDMTAAYAAFPNEGIYHTPITFTQVIDSNGKVVLKNKSVASTAIKKETAATMNSLLKGVVTNGTGTEARISGIAVAGKTGTTDDKKDRWFVGYSSDYVAAVWYGYDTPRAMNHISSNPSANAWKKVMEPILRSKGSVTDSFKVPENEKNYQYNNSQNKTETKNDDSNEKTEAPESENNVQPGVEVNTGGVTDGNTVQGEPSQPIEGTEPAPSPAPTPTPLPESGTEQKTP